MSKVLMYVVGGMGCILVLQYFLIGIHCKRAHKDKKEISDELIQGLKE